VISIFQGHCVHVIKRKERKKEQMKERKKRKKERMY
jgi:hypothetical protein